MGWLLRRDSHQFRQLQHSKTLLFFYCVRLTDGAVSQRGYGIAQRSLCSGQERRSKSNFVLP